MKSIEKILDMENWFMCISIYLHCVVCVHIIYPIFQHKIKFNTKRKCRHKEEKNQKMYF